MVIPYRTVKKQLLSLERRLSVKTQSNDIKMTLSPGYSTFLQPLTADLTEALYEIPNSPGEDKESAK